MEGEVKTPFPSPTGSISRAISSGGNMLPLIRRFNNGIISNDSHSKTIIVVVKFSSALKCLSNGGHKIIYGL